MIIILFCSVPYFSFFLSQLYMSHMKRYLQHTHMLTLNVWHWNSHSLKVPSEFVPCKFVFFLNTFFCYILRPQTCLSPSHVILIISNTKRGKAPEWLGLITKPLLWLLSLFNFHSFIHCWLFDFNFFSVVLVTCLH